MKYLLAILALLVPSVAMAGHVRVNCHRVVAFQKAVVLAQVYPASYYSVGAALQEEALAERIAKRVLAKLAEGRVDATSTDSVALTGLVAKRCVTCHDGKHPDTDFSLADLSKLSCEQKLHAINRVVLGEMPPKSQPALTGDEAGEILSQLSALSQPEK